VGREVEEPPTQGGGTGGVGGADAAVAQLCEEGHEIRDEDIARLSPLKHRNLNVPGRYSFQLPDLPGGLRPLRDPDAPEDTDENDEG
jgi:hypothetical protein